MEAERYSRNTNLCDSGQEDIKGVGRARRSSSPPQHLLAKKPQLLIFEGEILIDVYHFDV